MNVVWVGIYGRRDKSHGEGLVLLLEGAVCKDVDPWALPAGKTREVE